MFNERPSNKAEAAAFAAALAASGGYEQGYYDAQSDAARRHVDLRNAAAAAEAERDRMRAELDAAKAAPEGLRKLIQQRDEKIKALRDASDSDLADAVLRLNALREELDAAKAAPEGLRKLIQQRDKEIKAFRDAYDSDLAVMVDIQKRYDLATYIEVTDFTQWTAVVRLLDAMAASMPDSTRKKFQPFIRQ